MYANIHGVVAGLEKRIAALEARVFGGNDGDDPVDPTKPPAGPGQIPPKPQPDPDPEPQPPKASLDHVRVPKQPRKR